MTAGGEHSFGAPVPAHRRPAADPVSAPIASFVGERGAGPVHRPVPLVVSGDLGEVPTDAARRLTDAVHALLGHADGHSRSEPVHLRLRREGPLLHAVVRDGLCSPQCLADDEDAAVAWPRAEDDGAVQCHLREGSRGGLRVDWMLVSPPVGGRRVRLRGGAPG